LNSCTLFEIFEFLFHLNEQTVSENFEDVELPCRRFLNVNFISNCFEGLWSQNLSYKLLKGTMSNVETMLKNVYS
jgi:hypothetical protein